MNPSGIHAKRDIICYDVIILGGVMKKYICILGAFFLLHFHFAFSVIKILSEIPHASLVSGFHQFFLFSRRPKIFVFSPEDSFFIFIREFRLFDRGFLNVRFRFNASDLEDGKTYCVTYESRRVFRHVLEDGSCCYIPSEFGEIHHQKYIHQASNHQPPTPF